MDAVMSNAHSIRNAAPGDAAAIAAIYNLHVRSTIVTFELEEVSDGEMSRRISDVHSHELPWLVCVAGDEVLGYAYAGPWKARAAYARTVESSIYLRDDIRGRGVGASLYAALIERLKTLGIHVVIGGAALPNAASIALHERLGFEYVGTFREVGWKFERWMDVGHWQLRL